MPNDDAGRVSLWNDMVTYYQELAKAGRSRRLRRRTSGEGQGEGKKSIVASCPVTPISCDGTALYDCGGAVERSERYAE